MVFAVPDAWLLTIAVIAVILVLLIFPSVLAFYSKRKATTAFKMALDQSIDKPEQLDKVAQLYATSVDVEGIAASTRMTIATIALLIVGICLFSLMGLTSETTLLMANNSTNANTTVALTNLSGNITQIISIVLGILGGVLSAAVGFYFGSQAQTGTQLAAKGLEDARLEVEKQIKATQAAKKEYEALNEALKKLTPKPGVEPQKPGGTTEEPSGMIDQ
jgi:hypothetical protein